MGITQLESTDGGSILNPMTTSKLESFVRTILLVIVAAVASWAMNPAHLSMWLNATLATIVAGIAGTVENSLKQNGYGGVFGSFR